MLVLPTMADLLQQICNGLLLGSLFALVAVGYTMVYGILRLINFAHCDIFMMAMYIAFFTVASNFKWWIVSFVIVVAITAVLGC